MDWERLLNIDLFGNQTGGVLLHQFDYFDRSDGEGGRWWELSSASPQWSDRVSASLVNAGMDWTLAPSAPPPPAFWGQHAQQNGRSHATPIIPTFSDALAGLVLSPALLSPALLSPNHACAANASGGWPRGGLLCSYSKDSGSDQRTCNPPGVTVSCRPGCTWGERAQWCTATSRDYPCAWPAGDLSLMLETHRHNAQWAASDPTTRYNEVVLDICAFTAGLPGSILAVFYIARADEQCQSSNHWVRSRDRCEPHARRVHTALLRHFALSAAQLPLVRLDLTDWVSPFVCGSCAPRAE